MNQTKADAQQTRRAARGTLDKVTPSPCHETEFDAEWYLFKFWYGMHRIVKEMKDKTREYDPVLHALALDMNRLSDSDQLRVMELLYNPSPADSGTIERKL